MTWGCVLPVLYRYMYLTCFEELIHQTRNQAFVLLIAFESLLALHTNFNSFNIFEVPNLDKCFHVFFSQLPHANHH